MLDIYPSEHYGLSFFDLTDAFFFTRSPFFLSFFLYIFPFCKYTLYVCYVFNVNLTDSFDDKVPATCVQYARIRYIQAVLVFETLQIIVERMTGSVPPVDTTTVTHTFPTV